MPVDLKAIGRKLESVTHTYTERDVMLYALGVGAGTDELQFAYGRDLKVLPTFAVIPAFPAMLNLGGAMQVNPALVLHGEQRIELHAPIPTSGTIKTTPTIKRSTTRGRPPSSSSRPRGSTRRDGSSSETSPASSRAARGASAASAGRVDR